MSATSNAIAETAARQTAAPVVNRSGSALAGAANRTSAANMFAQAMGSAMANFGGPQASSLAGQVKASEAPKVDRETFEPRNETPTREPVRNREDNGPERTAEPRDARDTDARDELPARERPEAPDRQADSDPRDQMPAADKPKTREEAPESGNDRPKEAAGGDDRPKEAAERPTDTETQTSAAELGLQMMPSTPEATQAQTAQAQTAQAQSAQAQAAEAGRQATGRPEMVQAPQTEPQAPDLRPTIDAGRQNPGAQNNAQTAQNAQQTAQNTQQTAQNAQAGGRAPDFVNHLSGRAGPTMPGDVQVQTTLTQEANQVVSRPTSQAAATMAQLQGQQPQQPTQPSHLFQTQGPATTAPAAMPQQGGNLFQGGQNMTGQNGQGQGRSPADLFMARTSAGTTTAQNASATGAKGFGEVMGSLGQNGPQGPTGSQAAEQAARNTPQQPRHMPEPASDQVAVNIRKAAAQGQDRISIDLRPRELGRVEVQLELSRDGHLRAQIVADRPETLDMLQRDARGLERALQDAGIKADTGNLNFALREQNHQGDGQRNPYADGQGGRSGQGGGGDGEGLDLAAQAEARAQAAAQARGGLDIRI